MTVVEEQVPEGLRPEVDAAVGWFSEREGNEFQVTGILDPDAAVGTTGPRELRLVLCAGDRCEQRSFRVSPVNDGYDVALVDGGGIATAGGPPPAKLDPPPGALRGWLDRGLSEHAFVVLVFYRGFW